MSRSTASEPSPVGGCERPNFETMLRRLEEIVERLEANDLSLEEAIDAYQAGVTLAKEGHERLREAERKIEEVTRGGETRPVDPARILEERE